MGAIHLGAKYLSILPAAVTKSVGKVISTVILGSYWLCPTSGAGATQPLNPSLQIGVLQRFGEQEKSALRIRAREGDRLTLTFPVANQQKTLTAQQVEVSIAAKPLTVPVTEERVVLSIHRSFESAEATANLWEERGIAVEVAQPRQWQVWGNRDRYNTPQERQALLSQLKSQGLTNAHLDRRPIKQHLQLNWLVNGSRYSGDSLKISSGQNQVQVNGDRYGGSLKLQPNAYGSYTLVNQVPIETYLRGVVPHEIGPNAPTAAVEAQAILARTYALRNLRRFQIDNYELCADTQCQVYRGLNGTVSRVDRAIAATTGQVLTYNNELIDALYSSTTGGVTAAFEDVWEGNRRPYLRPVIDAVPNQLWDLNRRPLSQENNLRAFMALRQGFNEASWGYFRWRQPSSLGDLNRELRQFLAQKQSPLSQFQTIQQLQIQSRSLGGRVQRLLVKTDRGSITLTKDEILRCFSAPNSLLFYLEPRYGQNGKTLVGYDFVGGGLGHAVGLSQTGSYRLAELGWSVNRILDFYYPGTTLQPLHSKLIYWQDARALQARVEAQFTKSPSASSWSFFNWQFNWPLLNWFLPGGFGSF